MADSRYIRVSRARPCLICGKPDWCSRSADDSISFCARVTTGADRLSRKEQWGVFYHDRELLPKPNWKTGEPRNFHKRVEPEITPAPLEIRDFVYQTLLRLSPASNFQSLTEGAKGLLERGLHSMEDYGGLPCTIADRQDLAAQIRILLNQNFPAFVRQNPHGISHIPGFWINKAGEACLWSDKNFHSPMLIIPYRNPWGKIQACQLRFFGSDYQNQTRYLWLSLPSLQSAGSSTPLHFANWREFDKTGLNRSILVTEGALKADVVVNLLPQYLTIANSGVGCSHDLIARTSRGKKVSFAFDNDYQVNPAVIRQLAKLILTNSDPGDFQSIYNRVSILSWDNKFKGIDDALLNGCRITELSSADWFSMLSSENRQVFEEIFYHQKLN